MLIVWGTGAASIGITLASFLEQHRRTESASFTFITHPVGRPSVLRETEFIFYPGDGVPQGSVLPREKHIPLVTPIIDGLLTLLFLARVHQRHDIYITAGLNLGLLGILLRGVGVVKKTAFVIMDYWPQKFGSTILSRLYRWLYSWCCTSADFVVDVAPTINEARLRDGIRVHPEKLIYAPHPIDPPETGLLPQKELEPDSLVWTGAFTQECGFELVIEAIEQVALVRPGVVVNITSYEPFREDLQKAIKEKRLEKHFRLLGYVKEEAEFNKVVGRHRIGLAPYRPDDLSVKNFAGVARPWTYMANGVPPIITRVPPDAREIEAAEAGLVIDYDKEQLARAILMLLKDDQLHQRCRERGLELVKGRATGPVFNTLLTRLGFSLDGHAGSAAVGTQEQ